MFELLGDIAVLYRRRRVGPAATSGRLMSSREKFGSSTHAKLVRSGVMQNHVVSNNGLKFATQEADSVEFGTWCWPRVVLIEKRPLTECERSSTNRAARSVGAQRVRRLGRNNRIWRLSDDVAARWQLIAVTRLSTGSRLGRRLPNDLSITQV